MLCARQSLIPFLGFSHQKVFRAQKLAMCAFATIDHKFWFQKFEVEGYLAVRESFWLDSFISATF